MYIGCCNFDCRVYDFFGFGYYFLFFFGGVVFYEYIDVWDDVKGDFFGVNFGRYI